MSTIDYTWHTGKPPAPDVYTTRNGTSRHQTLRYWDGGRWWQIEWGKSRHTRPFKWPKGSRTRFPSGMVYYRDTMGLRRINSQDAIQWGCPFRVYDDKEVLAHLIKTGVIPRDWRTVYQAEMRAADNRKVQG